MASTFTGSKVASTGSDNAEEKERQFGIALCLNLVISVGTELSRRTLGI